MTKPRRRRRFGIWGGKRNDRLRAPIKNAAKDFPALIAMQKSVHLDLAVLQDNANRVMARMNEQTNRWIAENKAAGDAARDRSVAISMANAQGARDAMDRSTAGFINHILDRRVVQHNPTGAHGTMDIGLASALERSDPQNFSPVPISQYVKGVDYWYVGGKVSTGSTRVRIGPNQNAAFDRSGRP